MEGPLLVDGGYFVGPCLRGNMFVVVFFNHNLKQTFLAVHMTERWYLTSCSQSIAVGPGTRQQEIQLTLNSLEAKHRSKISLHRHLYTFFLVFRACPTRRGSMVYQWQFLFDPGVYRHSPHFPMARRGQSKRSGAGIIMDHGLVLFNVIQDSKLESLLRSFQLCLNFIGNSKPRIETYSLRP